MFEEKIKLSSYSNYKIGGLASYFFEAKKIEEIFNVLKKWRSFAPPRSRWTCAERSRSIFILGGGTNILFGDDDFDGLILKPAFNGIRKIDDFSLLAGAGVLMDDLVNYFLDKGFAGLEWAGGLPGTLGGAIRGNAGAFSGEIKDIIREVVSVNIPATNSRECFHISAADPQVIKRTNEECGFSYRDSVFKKSSLTDKEPKEIIIEAILNLKRGDKKSIKDIVQKNVLYRKERQPLEYPNIGSIFKNINVKKAPENRIKEFKSVIKTDPFPVIPAAHLISEAGLKGISFGGAMISPKHPNFIVNVMNASSNDVKNLIELAKLEVKNKFNIDLEEEIVMLP